jgi:uracil-DNA glycosylase
MHPFYEFILETTGLTLLKTTETPRLDPQTNKTPIPPQKIPALYGDLKSLHKKVLGCTQCGLHKGKTNYVFGEGNPAADLFFIGEGPGREEDLSGRPFVGRSGKLLTKIIEAMKLSREDVFIGNVVKCRPPENRAPLPEEANTCIPYLQEQLKIIQPKVVVLLGATAAAHMMGYKIAISKIRGTWTEIKLPSGERFKAMPTFHPAALLRNPNLKKDVWADMKKVMSEIGQS